MSLTLTQNSATSGTHHAGRSRPSLLARLYAAVAQEIRIRRDMRHLSGLGEAALHDIGLTRGGVEDAVRHGRPDMPGLDIASPMLVDMPDASAYPLTEAQWR